MEITVWIRLLRQCRGDAGVEDCEASHRAGQSGWAAVSTGEGGAKMGKMKVVLLQTKVSERKQENLDAVEEKLQMLREEKPDLVMLPEMFNCPYQTDLFPLYAEREGGESWQALSRMAGREGIYLAAGSIPEVDEEGRVYNTAYVFDRGGRQIAKHRKMHLFDINVTGGQYFKESDTLTAGDQVTVFDSEFGKMGICICFDIRFPELSRLMAQEGAQIILIPGAFNMTTGPAHWELSFRARALDNQVYVLGAAPARDAHSSYTSWGHSIVVNPWGQVLGQLDEREGCLIQELDLDEVVRIRRDLPLLRSRRLDLYRLDTL